MKKTSIALDDQLADKARDLNINVSEVTREALRERVRQAELAKGHGMELVKITHQDQDAGFWGKAVCEAYSGGLPRYYYVTRKRAIVACVEVEDGLFIEELFETADEFFQQMNERIDRFSAEIDELRQDEGQDTTAEEWARSEAIALCSAVAQEFGIDRFRLLDI